jgi:hypothetical protein
MQSVFGQWPTIHNSIQTDKKRFLVGQAHKGRPVFYIKDGSIAERLGLLIGLEPLAIIPPHYVRRRKAGVTGVLMSQ